MSMPEALPDLSLRQFQRRAAWDMYAAGVMSIRFHPKDDITGMTAEDLDKRVQLAVIMANRLLESRDQRFPEDV